MCRRRWKEHWEDEHEQKSTDSVSEREDDQRPPKRHRLKQS